MCNTGIVDASSNVQKRAQGGANDDQSHAIEMPTSGLHCARCQSPYSADLLILVSDKN